SEDIKGLEGKTSDLIERANNINDILNEHGGKIENFELEIDDIEQKLGLNLEEIERLDDAITANSTAIETTAQGINTRIDNFEAQYADDKATILNSIEQNRLDIQATAKGLELAITRDEYEKNIGDIEDRISSTETTLGIH